MAGTGTAYHKSHPKNIRAREEVGSTTMPLHCAQVGPNMLKQSGGPPLVTRTSGTIFMRRIRQLDLRPRPSPFQQNTATGLFTLFYGAILSHITARGGQTYLLLG